MNIDIVVPIYRSLEATRRCVESVLVSTDLSCARLILVNDASPEEELAQWCREVAAEDHIILLEHQENLGFVASVNEGMNYSRDRDVVLLNSDTEVPQQWLERLRRCAYDSENIGTVTPFSNNGSICSYPYFCNQAELPPGMDLETTDALFERANAGRSMEIPTAVGFCTYIRRECITQVGLFDVERFGRGYGEENDFSMRASDLGWKNMLCADLFVYHRGGLSFGDERSALMTKANKILVEKYPRYPEIVAKFVAADPLRPFRESVDQCRVKEPEQVSHVLEEAAQRHTELLKRQIDLNDSVLQYEASLSACSELLDSQKRLLESQVQQIGEFEQRCRDYESVLDSERKAFSDVDKELSRSRDVITERDETNRMLREELEMTNGLWSVRLERKLFKK